MGQDEEILIRQFENFINNEAQKVGYYFEQLSSVGDYIGKVSLCGIFCIDNDKWLFVHQGYVESGEPPKDYFEQYEYSSLQELIEVETARIKGKLKLQEEMAQQKKGKDGKKRTGFWKIFKIKE